MTVRTPWRLEVDGQHVTWWDRACHDCPSCRAGEPARCGRPVDAADREGAQTYPVEGLEAYDPATLETAAVALDLALNAEAGPAVLLVGAGRQLHDVGRLLDQAGVRPLVLHGDAPSGAGLPVAVGDEVRRAFATSSPSGRADVVLALDGDLATAAKLVRRGGAIGTTVPATSTPTLAAVVQREVAVLRPRDPRDAYQRLHAAAAHPMRLKCDR